MKRIITTTVFTLMLLCIGVVYAQDYRTTIEDALSKKECDKAKKVYQWYKEDGGESDQDLEKRIVDCGKFDVVDSDDDGIPDDQDQCPDTPAGIIVDAKGCPLNSDRDGVPDYTEQYPNTPQSITVNAKDSPSDSDGDGVPDYIDQCPNTPQGILVNAKGCPLDSDGDGIPDYRDQCPNTPPDVYVDAKGCPLVESNGLDGANPASATFADNIKLEDANPVNLSIGMPYQGGIIFYLDKTKQHGLIAAQQNQSSEIQWYNGNYITTGATGTEIETGKSNTAKIVQSQGSGNYAAKLCDDLVLNGYDDWFLPSKDELNLLYLNKNKIGVGRWYWSSSEYNNNYVWYQDFNTGYQYYGSKSGINGVLAIRAF